MTLTAPEHVELTSLYEDLRRRHVLELRLGDALTNGAGIIGIVKAAEAVSDRSVWLLDHQGRSVVRPQGKSADPTVPDLRVLLQESGCADTGPGEPVLLVPRPARRLVRRHIIAPVARGEELFAWLVLVEVPRRFTAFDRTLAERTARHLAAEYATQQRIARVSWNARSTLARQMVRGSVRDDDLQASAHYLGIEPDADRVIVYLTDGENAEPRDDRAISDELATSLGVEVLGARGSQGSMLLVEVPQGSSPVVMIRRTQQAVETALRREDLQSTIAGLSAVAAPGELNRAYQEAREVVQCVDRFSASGTRVIAADDLGPARLFIANSDVDSVRRYVRDVLGTLLTGESANPDLLRTLRWFFDTGRSIRSTAALLRVHENTVRLRLAKIRDQTGLDVAANATDQLSVQTALLVLRLEGHPAISDGQSHHGTDSLGE